MTEEAGLCPQLDAVVKRHGELRRAGEAGRKAADETMAIFQKALDTYLFEPEDLKKGVAQIFAWQEARDRERASKPRRNPFDLRQGLADFLANPPPPFRPVG